MNESPPIDPPRIDELTKLFGDRAILMELFDEFLQACPSRIQAMREGIANAQPDLLDCGAHAIKGSSANLGATEIQKVAALIEGLARANDLQEADQFLNLLESEIERLQVFLKGSGLYFAAPTSA